MNIYHFRRRTNETITIEKIIHYEFINFEKRIIIKNFILKQQRIVTTIINQILNARLFSSNFAKSQKFLNQSKLNNIDIDVDDNK